LIEFLQERYETIDALAKHFEFDDSVTTWEELKYTYKMKMKKNPILDGVYEARETSMAKTTTSA